MIRTLVVDDNFVNRKLLMSILKTTGPCDVAANGREALEAYHGSIRSGQRYDIMLLDVMMPEVDGIQVLQSIREEEKKNNVSADDRLPIIMITAQKDHFLKTFDLGCDDYFLKPIDADKLIEKINEKKSKKK